MTSPTPDDGGYDLKPQEPAPPSPQPRRPRPGEPGWVEPVPIVERIEVRAEPVIDDDAEKNKAAAILAYIFFVFPLVAAPQSKFARFHANQGLLTFICWAVAVMAVIVLHFGRAIMWMVLGNVVILASFISCITYLLQPALLLGALMLTVMGIINAANSETKALPLVGHWQLIK